MPFCTRKLLQMLRPLIGKGGRVRQRNNAAAFRGYNRYIGCVDAPDPEWDYELRPTADSTR